MRKIKLIHISLIIMLFSAVIWGLKEHGGAKKMRIGIVTDSTYEKDVKKHYPDAQISYFSNISDMITALKAGKIDAFPEDEPKVKQIARHDSAITYTDSNFTAFDTAYIFAISPKGAVLCGKFDDFIKQKRESGELEKLAEKWFDADESNKIPPPIADLKNNGEILDMATDLTSPPFAYIKDGKPAGYDIELAYIFCKENGYSLEIKDMAFDGIIPSIMSDKCDFGGAGITCTDERRENVYFSEPVFTLRSLMAKLNIRDLDESFWQRTKESFEKTFIREKRYKLFLNGIYTTMFITVLSLILGTLLGFWLYIECRKGSLPANITARILNHIIQDVPTVVLLMVLYYVIFGKTAIDGIWVAVLCFTLTFCASMYSMLDLGVSTVGEGQIKAAYALGFSKKQTFYKIILPQAAQKFMPTYKTEVIAHIKNTAVVGYVAVQDLTKMGDIVRSLTYEAFFPLISVSVIYFLLAAFLTAFINRIIFKTDTTRRKKAQILKGIKTDDNT